MLNNHGSILTKRIMIMIFYNHAALVSVFWVSASGEKLRHRTGCSDSRWLTMKVSMLSLVRLVQRKRWMVPCRTSSCSAIRRRSSWISSRMDCSWEETSTMHIYVAFHFLGINKCWPNDVEVLTLWMRWTGPSLLGRAARQNILSRETASSRIWCKVFVSESSVFTVL